MFLMYYKTIRISREILQRISRDSIALAKGLFKFLPQDSNIIFMFFHYSSRKEEKGEFYK